MAKKTRVETVAAMVRFPVDLLSAIDERVREEDLDRSKYIRQLVRRDLAQHAGRIVESTETTEVAA